MTTISRPERTVHRPASVWGALGGLAFLGLTAVAGGAALALDLGASPPTDWLDHIPLIDSWLIPGLVLGIGFGGGSLTVAYGVLRRPRWPGLAGLERLTRHHWSWMSTILLGVGQAVWLSLEVVYFPQLSALQAVYGVVAAALIALPMTASMRRYLRDVRPGQPGPTGLSWPERR